MRKNCGLFLSILFLTAIANAVPIVSKAPGTGNEAEYYTPGIINPSEGTVELTALPVRPGSEFQNKTFFAFVIAPGQKIKGNSLLALFTPSGANGHRGFSALARIGGKTYYAQRKNQDFLKPGVPVNVALSWGKAGLLTYVDGKLFGKGTFPENGILAPMSAVFKLGNDHGFNIQAAKISTRQLPSNALATNPAAGFTVTSDTSFLLRKNKPAEYFSTNYSEKYFSILMPIWRPAGSMSPDGGKGEITLLGLNLSSAPVTYTIKIDAKNSEGVDAGSMSTDMTLSDKPEFVEQQVMLPIKNTGFYHLNIQISGQDGRKTVYESTYMIYPPNDKNIKDGKFAGYMGHHLLKSPEVLNELGIRWSRAWGDGKYFLWYNVEPQKGVFNWTYTDKAVAEAEKNGVHILGVLGNPPLWAAKNPRHKKAPHRLAFMSGRWKPRNIQEWETYVYQTVLRYKGKVKYWEVYNEVDFHPPGSQGSFSGTTEDYFELLKTAWEAAKKANPDCKILISGFNTGASADLNMPYKLLEMGATKYIDIFSMHSYQGILGVDKLRQAVHAVAPGMPFWQTEQGWLWIDNPWKRCALTAAIQFWFIEKQFDKYFNFGAPDFVSRYTKSPKMVLSTLAAVQNNLRKCDSYIGTMPDSKIRDFDVKHCFKRTDGNYFTAIGKTGVQTELRLSGDVISAEDLLGRKLRIVRSGTISILPAAFIVSIVSRTPLKIIDAKCISKDLVENPGFENVSGDSMGGVKGLIVRNWQLNSKGGEIILDPDAHSGKYAIKISSNYSKRVSISIETRGLAIGRYVLSAWLKSGREQPGNAAFSMYDLVTQEYVMKKVTGIPSDKYTKYTAEFELKSRSKGVVKFYIGLSGGLILCDDVKLTKQPIMHLEMIKNVKINNHDSRLKIKSGKLEIDLQNMVSRVGGTQTIDGVMVKVSRTPVVLSGSSKWNGIAGKTLLIPLAGYFSKIAFLTGAMYVPANANPELGSINIVYRDGGSAVITLENNKNIRDWWLASTPGGITPDLYFSDAGLGEYGLFMPVWNNPSPQKEIVSVRITASTDGLICLAAITAEKRFEQ